jgi:Domain of unknown function (DUF1887).
MRTLVCLLSRQPIPNIVSVHCLCPDRLVLVETEQAKKENLLQSLKERGLDFTDSSKHESVFVENQNSFPGICETLRKIAEKHQDDEVYVNLTGGTKPMSMAALESFRNIAKTNKFIYVAENEDQKIRDFFTYSVIPSAIEKHQFTVKEFALAYGFEFQKNITKIQEAEEIATGRWEIARIIAKHANTTEISFGGRDNPDDDYEVIQLLRNGKSFHDLQLGQVSIHSEEIRHALTEIDSNIRFESHNMLGKVERSLGEFLTGGWLEEFIWGLLVRKAEQLGFHDIRLGVVLSLRDKAMNNDLDVAFMDGTYFTTIECKSGTQGHVTPQEILYKLSQVSSQQGALHAQSLLVATSEQFFDKERKLKESLKDRAAHYHIKLILRDEIVALANNPDDVDFIKKTFAHKK